MRRDGYVPTHTQQHLSVQAVEPHPWRHELNDLVRGLAGGFLFGIPLLYTMEVWWLGIHAEPWHRFS